jgi:hypothetical protein
VSDCCGICGLFARRSYDDSDLEAAYPKVCDSAASGKLARVQGVKSELLALQSFIVSTISTDFGSLDYYNQCGQIRFLRKKLDNI